MSISLGDALTGNNAAHIDLDNKLLKEEGYRKARAEVGTNKGQPDQPALDEEALDGALKAAFLKALDIAIDDVLGSAWAGWSELKKYADPTSKGINFVSLSDHVIESAHEPSVDIELGGETIHSFDFKVAATLKVEGVRLEVEQGKIQAIHLGRLTLGGAVTLGDQTLLEKAADEITLPGVMRLQRPIPIR